MSDREFKIINNVLEKYNENDTHVVVPKEIVEIGDKAFESKRIDEIVLPSSLKKIGKEAFNMTFIEDIVLEHVIEIQDGAFSHCPKLKRIEIPEGIDVISARMFYDCVNLKEIILPSTVKVIEEYAFKDCHELVSIVLPEGLEVIGNQAFCYCNKLRELHIPDSVHTIGKEAFKYAKSLYKINIPKNVKVIKEGTFQSCKNLKSITILDTVEVIENRAFSNCVALKDVYDVFNNSKSFKDDITIEHQKKKEDKKIEVLSEELQLDKAKLKEDVEKELDVHPQVDNTYMLFELMDESTKKKWQQIQRTLELCDFLQGVNYGFHIVPNKTKCVEIIKNDDDMLKTLVHIGIVKMVKTYLDYKPSISFYKLEECIVIYNKYKEYMDPLILEYLEEYKSNHFSKTNNGIMSFEVIKEKATFIKYIGHDQEIVIPNKVGKYDVCLIDGYIDCIDNDLRSIHVYVNGIKEIKRLFFEKNLFNNTKIFHVYISNDVKIIGGIMYDNTDPFKNLVGEGNINALQDNIIIYASKDSIAYKYAKDNGLEVVEK